MIIFSLFVISGWNRYQNEVRFFGRCELKLSILKLYTYLPDWYRNKIHWYEFFHSNQQTKMNVIISYDTETTSATDFFQKQFTADLFKQFSDCDVINWNFMPCGTSRVIFTSWKFLAKAEKKLIIEPVNFAVERWNIILSSRRRSM